MNILFISISLGDLSINQGLYTNLANEFKNQGHNVYALNPIKSEEYSKTNLCEENEIKIIRVKTNKLKGVSNIKKGMAYIKMVFQFYYYIRKFYWNIKFDFIIAPSLPPEIGVIVKMIKGHFKCPFYLLQYDYTWPSSVKLGFFSEKSIICNYYKWIEKIAFKVADHIALPTIGNIDYLKEHYPYVPHKKIHLLPMFLDPVKKVSGEDTFRKENNLEEKFLVVYGGSLGITQKIDHLINLAESCADYKDIVFIILGKGDFLEKTKKITDEKGLKNIKYVGFMPQKKYLQFLSTCDVGLIVLNERLGAPNFPSKTISYFNMRVPVLASIDYVTDYGNFLEYTQTGLWSYSGDNNSFKANLIKMYNSPELLEEMKKNEEDYYERYMKPSIACKSIISHLNIKN